MMSVKIAGGSLRIKAMLSCALGSVDFGGIGEGIVGPVHEGVLAEHGSHDDGCDGFVGLCGSLEAAVDLSRTQNVRLDAMAE